MSDKYDIAEKELERKFGRDLHMRVPDNYFDSMTDKVLTSLPEMAAIERHVEMTRWQKLKPYVYLAAMFGGIWLMMNVFGRFMKTESIDLDNPPQQIALLMDQAAQSESFYVPDNMLSDMEIENDVASSYDSIEDFEEDFESLGETE